eukprot:881178-Rhodomonas_salina.3
MDCRLFCHRFPDQVSANFFANLRAKAMSWTCRITCSKQSQQNPTSLIFYVPDDVCPFTQVVGMVLVDTAHEGQIKQAQGSSIYNTYPSAEATQVAPRPPSTTDAFDTTRRTTKTKPRTAAQQQQQQQEQHQKQQQQQHKLRTNSTSNHRWHSFRCLITAAVTSASGKRTGCMASTRQEVRCVGAGRQEKLRRLSYLWKTGLMRMM